MRLYTKTGDDGTTGLFGGTRVEKDEARVEAYGSVDETNAAVGLVRAFITGQSELDCLLGTIQEDLFALGSELACTPGKARTEGSRGIDVERIACLERAIDGAVDGLPPLRQFVLPAGTQAAAALHLARTVCRRAERRVVTVHRTAPVRSELLVYLNRLSDLLFALARRHNHDAHVGDTPWTPRLSSSDR